ncbi:MAG: LytR/AlgR family response regulator transcription factor [Bacteroidia bacterium]
MKVLVIEDEMLASQRLIRMIKELEPEVEILDSLESVEETLEWWAENPAPELMFMDIHLADGSAFEILRQLEVECPIVFTTAYDSYAIEAFKHNSIDYILKPVKQEELKAALAKFLRSRPEAQSPTFDYQELAKALQQKNQPKRLLIRFGQQLKAVEFSEVAYFYIEERVCFVMTHAGKRYPIDQTLDQLDAILTPEQFFRINRQLIANMEAIDQMHTMSKSRVKISLKPEAPVDALVSSERSALFKKWLKGEV